MNKVLFLSLSLLLAFSGLQAQQKALTESGDEVLLYDDGTWRYSEPQEVEMAVDNIPLTVNPKRYTTPKNSDFRIKSKRNDFTLSIDKDLWSFQNSTVNTQAEYQLEMRDGDLYGIMINEAIEIPLEKLRDIAVLNARSAAPDMVLLKQEMRTVNGLEVLFVEFEATLQGIAFHYFNYYTTNASGSTQLLTYTSKNLADKYRKEAEKLLNGLELAK